MAELLLGAPADAADGEGLAVASQDLVTHAVIVGMTGSGKTGLGVVLAEECLAHNIPALVIDPKGDLTNLALVFPSLQGPEFEPWVDPAQAIAAGQSTPDFAQGQATLWRDGLARWGIGPEQMSDYRGRFDLTVYTPGSTAGVPLNVLGSLAAPTGADAEIVADEIEGYVTGLLGLVGIVADPLSSREHILLSNIIGSAWSAGEDLDLAALLARVQQPPMRKLGVFELDQFFPAKERLAFAMKLNGLLAAPGFQAWMQGDPVDIQSMLWGSDGRPRCAVVTTSHLSDDQRQAVTAMLLAKLVTWMRRQSGTTDLRALVYMDEVAGYLPPTAMPPTKKPIMLLMKQARAFGLGVVLSTQNPVDIDYKALSNAGTWMVGRLTTARDKERLLAGMSAAVGGIDPAELDRAISALGKRQFLIRRAGRNEVEPFATKWARSYLRGPLTREQIGRLSRQLLRSGPTGQSAPAPDPGGPTAQHPTTQEDDQTPVMPPVAQGTPVVYLDPAAPWAGQVGAIAATGSGPRLQAGAVARVALRYDEAKADLVHDEEYEAVIFPLPVAPAEVAPLAVDFDDRDFAAPVPQGGGYALPEAPVGTKTYWSSLARALQDHLVRTRSVRISANPELKLYSRVGESQEDFIARCRTAAREAADAKTAALRNKYEGKLRTMQSRLETAQSKIQAAESARSAQMLDSVGSVLGGFLGGRRSASAIASAARRHQAASHRVDQAALRADDLSRQLAELESGFADEVAQIDAEWQQKAAAVSPLDIPLEKSDVRVTDMRLVWIPVG